MIPTRGQRPTNCFLARRSIGSLCDTFISNRTVWPAHFICVPSRTPFVKVGSSNLHLLIYIWGLRLSFFTASLPTASLRHRDSEAPAPWPTRRYKESIASGRLPRRPCVPTLPRTYQHDRRPPPSTSAFGQSGRNLRVSDRD